MKSNTQNITSRQITTLQKSFLRFLGVFFFILSIKFSIFSQSPTVTTRFANPIFNCNNEYCVDVQFKANVPNVRLFGINFRFFYPDSTLELIGFNNFSPGYGILNSPIITSLPNTAAVLFSFNSPPEWVNGNIELMDPNIITYLDTANWTKLFSVCFHIDDPNPNPQSFCVPLVLDLEQDPENGGYLPGDDGLIITIVDPQNSSQTYPADENVIQFNWMYVGDGIVPPFGIPQNNNCITLTPDCNPYITCPGNRIVQCAESTDPANTGFATSTDICDGDPVTVYNDVISSGSCSQGYSILRRWIVTNACNKSDTCFQTILVVDTIPPAITCPADITVFCPANPTFATPVMNDVCDPNPILSFTDMNVFNGCAASHVITRTWTATDHCGNASTCTSKITYKDETAPAMTCPVNVTLNCQDDNSSANTGAATATDICSSAVVTQSQTSTRSADPEDCSHYTYTINRLWIATDACGNSSTCIQTISVHDVTPPVITCPSNLTILFSENTLPGNTGNATAIDNCNPAISPTYTDITSPQTCSPVHRIFRTWKAMDACGNSTTCQQTITINDKGTICGSVHDDLGQAMAGIEIRLEADINGNQAFDAGDTLIATVFSAAGTGQFCFSNVIPCNYVLVEIQPASYGNLSDFDSTPDPDGDDSSDGPDNQIPVVLSPGENDLDNNFIDIICPTQLPVISPDTICANGSVVFQTSNIPLGTLTYSWDFGSGSTPGTAIGLGPNTVSYVTTTNNQVNGAVVSMSIAKTGCSTLTGQVSHVIVNPYAVATINSGPASFCYYTDRIFQPVAAQIPGATYSWNFGSGAVPATATGYGPHTVYYTTVEASKTVKLVVHPNQPGAQCPDSATTSFAITNCPANITGSVKSSTDQSGIGSVNIKLYKDFNLDGFADDTVWVQSKNTVSGTGNYSMTSIVPGSYVLIETQPSGWVSFNDRDFTPDGDLVPNIDSLDNLIPVTLRATQPSTTDGGNFFFESPGPGDISGYVFYDADGDELPGVGEGLNNVVVKVFPDTNGDGHADNGTAIFTQTTSSSGFFSFPVVPLGHYVITQEIPQGYILVKDYDATNDLDVPDNFNLHDDTIQVTILQGEHDAQNYFVDGVPCNLVVTNTLDSGTGSLRDIIACAAPGSTITFAASLSGMTINITSGRIEINKELTISSTLVPRVTIKSQTAGLFKILSNNIVQFRQLDIISGVSITGNLGATFENQGDLRLQDIHVLRNPDLPPGQYLIRNVPGSGLMLSGSCLIQMN